MTLRTSYIVGLIACTAVGLTSVQIIESAQAETLKITGPNGEVKQPAKRQYGPTTSRDTFWSIAQKVRPSDKVSVYQVMAALFDANPHAFSGNNYNTLERGMILLIPSADEIAAIPNDVAKRRAEQDDSRMSRQTQPRPASKPVQSPKVDIAKKPTATKPLQIAPQTPAVEVQTKAINQANVVEVSELNSSLDKANAKTLMLTDELARSQDELMVSNNDNQALKNKIEQMSLNISSLEEDLQLLREKFDALSLENKKLVDQGENAAPVIEEPTDFWRSLMDNTMLLILAASVPLLAIFGLIFWLLSRRSKKSQQSETNTEAQAEKALDPTQAADDSDDIVVHLDTDDEESIDDLLDLDSVDLQPEVQMSGDAEMDMASDMFIDEKVPEDEGTSLDDLWAEAMDDQDSDLPPLEDDDDLDSLLAGLDDDPDQSLDSTASEDDINSLLAELDADDIVNNDTDALDAAAEDDIDSLLAEFDMPAESVAAAAAVKPQQSTAEDDIDSLLAEFDMPAESDEADKPIMADSAEDDIDSLLAEFDLPAESDAAPAVSKSEAATAEDDIDSLLAEFDLPAESDAAPAQSKPEAATAEDDIDSLLAEFDLPAESDAAPAESKPEAATAEDDIDSLLAEFDMPAESDAAPAVSKPEAATAEDDIDSLLAEFDLPAEPGDAPAESDETISTDDYSPADDTNDNADELLAGLSATKDESDQDGSQDSGDNRAEADEFAPLTSDSVDNDDDIAALIAAELQDDADDQDEQSSDEDIDSLLASLNEPVIDSTFAEEDDDLAAQIAAELTDEDITDSNDDNETSDDDIDALLASLNDPVIESDTTDKDNAALQAQIAAELEDDTAAEELVADDESIDDDINALLASFEEKATDDSSSVTDAESSTSVEEALEDNELFDEFDQYLTETETDLASTDDDDVEANQAPAAAEPKVDTAVDSEEEDNSWLEAELEAALASSSSTDSDVDSDTEVEPEPATKIAAETDDGLEALLAQMDDDDTPPSVAQNKANKDSGFFNDLKSSKPKPELLDWESDLLNAVESAADEREVDEPQVSDDDLLAAFSQSLKDDDNEDDYSSEDDYILSDNNLTVDEALAALDEKERSKSSAYKASDDDLMRFERENGYIDIDKLLNDADEDDDKTDQYKDVSVDMGSVNSLIGNPDMVDVDDEENSVNAKLDLARAYIEIEDQDSARALLKEVQIDGNERQQLEAKNLINSFS
jgi:pilus assembly protein FimV